MLSVYFFSATNKNKKMAWIGVRNLEKEGVWVWIDGTSEEDRDILWGPDESKSRHNVTSYDKNCAIMTKSFMTNEYFCSNFTSSLCEKREC